MYTCISIIWNNYTSIHWWIRTVFICMFKHMFVAHISPHNCTFMSKAVMHRSIQIILSNTTAAICDHTWLGCLWKWCPIRYPAMPIKLPPKTIWSSGILTKQQLFDCLYYPIFCISLVWIYCVVASLVLSIQKTRGPNIPKTQLKDQSSMSRSMYQVENQHFKFQNYILLYFLDVHTMFNHCHRAAFS